MDLLLVFFVAVLPSVSYSAKKGDCYKTLKSIGGLKAQVNEGLPYSKKLESKTAEERSLNDYFHYLAEVRRHFPPLSQDKNLALIREFQKTGDLKIRNKIVSHNLGLTARLVRKYQWAVSSVLDRMDLLQAGNEGLIKAVSAYEPALDYSFSTFAASYIEGSIKSFLVEQAHVVRVKNLAHKIVFWNLERQKEDFFSRNEKFDSALAAENMSTDRTEVTAEMLEWTDNHLQDTISFNQQPAMEQISSNRLLEENPNPEKIQSFEEIYRTENLSLENTVVIEEQIAESIENLRNLLQMLPSSIEHDIFIKRVLTYPPLTLREIGENYNVHPEKIRQITFRTIRRIKYQMVRSNKYNELLYLLLQNLKNDDLAQDALISVNSYMESAYGKAFHEYFPLRVSVDKEQSDFF